MRVLRKSLSLLLALALTLSLMVVPAFAEEEAPAAVFTNTSEDGGKDMISLSDARSFRADIPVDMSLEEAQAAAETVTWSLLRDDSKEYVDPELYPNQSEGGTLDSWLCSDGSTPLFSNVETTAVKEDGQVYLSVTFDNGIYFYSRGEEDASAPHSNGGSYLDVCGYFELTASADETVLGSADVKITPYDTFHTMSEIYEEIDSIAAYADENTDLYVEKFSMGLSQGNNGLDSLDMPYLIVAKDKEAVENWLALAERAETEPDQVLAELEDGTLTDYQVPVMYTNIHSNEVAASDGILQFAWMLVNAAAGDGTIDYNYLTGFTEEGETELAEQMGAEGEAGSLAIPDLVADKATYLGYIKNGSTSAEVDLDTYYTTETRTADVDELLDSVFFIIVPEENVEGRTYVTRTSSGGFDLNRDNSFQTQAETQNMSRLIATYNPVSLTEFHGRVKTFQCEPCDPPHEPNFEYDLLAEHLMGGGEALGIAAVANNDSYNSYVIPQRDYLEYTGETTEDGSYETYWSDPWDDMSTSYTPQYSMLHGTVAYTVELPAYNADAATAAAYGQLGQAVYVAENAADYLKNQVTIYSRGVNNENSDAYELVGQWFCDQYDVEGAEMELFRPEYDGEGQNGNFYPECYIIPLDGENQTSLQAAYDMIEWLSRNDVKIMIATESFTYDGVTYPAGTAVVSMYQAKRSVANGALYDGTVITSWTVLYSEGITAFGKTRGFDMVTCAEPAAYETIAAACGTTLASEEEAVAYISTLTSYFTGAEGADVVISNASEDSTAAVNALLQAGKTVAMITEGEYKGDFICSYEDWLSVSEDYILTGTGVTEVPTAYVLENPTVYISGTAAATVSSSSGFIKTKLVSGSYSYNYDRQALDTMNFLTTDDASAASVIVGATALDEGALSAVQSGTPYMGYGDAASAVCDSEGWSGSVEGSLFSTELAVSAVGGYSMDALSYVKYGADSLITASYVSDEDDILYGYGVSWFSAVPEGSETLITTDSEKGLLEGFITEGVDGYDIFTTTDTVQAISYQGPDKNGNEINICLFANTLTHKTHQRDDYGYIANFILANSMTDTLYGGEEISFTDVAESDWFAPAVNAAAEAGIVSGMGDGTFAPNASVTREQAAKMIVIAAGALDESASADFIDMDEASDWAVVYIASAQAAGLMQGNDDGSFEPADTMTRAELAALVCQVKGLTDSAENPFSDVTETDWFIDEVSAAAAAGYINGLGDGTYAPNATVSRAQFAQVIYKLYLK